MIHVLSIYYALDMGIFSFLFKKKIFRKKLERLLWDIDILSPTEREYVQGVFRKYESGGITRFEVEEAVRDLKFDNMDPINQEEANAVRKKLLDNL